MDPLRERSLLMTRRHFFGRSAAGIGTLALGSLLNPSLFSTMAAESEGGLPLGKPHFAPKAKRVIYLFMAGGPAQMDLLDYKPTLEDLHGKELPASIRMGQRLTGMTSGQSSFPVVKSMFKFAPHGKSGAYVSELLPNIAEIVDDICIVKTVNTEAINHDPAITFIQTGFQQPGRPCMGSWLSYGLGCDNKNLPAFIVMISSGKESDQPLYTRLWSSGFLPATFQGTQFRTDGTPIFHLAPPATVSDKQQRSKLDLLAELNRHFGADKPDDSELAARLNSYELAYRMQSAAPEAVELAKESEATKQLYGLDEEPTRKFGTLCLLARRLVERGVHFVQLYCGSNSGWDAHVDLEENHSKHCRESDKPIAGLLADLKTRGLLDSTLVVWSSEFGRTPLGENRAGFATVTGRDHHPNAYSIWMAGGGIKGGQVVGETDEFGFGIVKEPVHVNDFHATILHLFGLDHTRLIYRFQGRDFRLTDVAGKVVHQLIA